MRITKIFIVATGLALIAGAALAQTAGAPVIPPMGIGGAAVPAYEVTVSGGTVASNAIQWVYAAFGVSLGLALTLLAVKGLQLVGIKVTDAQKEQLNKLVVNGLNLAVAASKNLEGKAPIEVKNAAAAQTVAYVQTHGADLLKSMGLDPKSGQVVEAINARIETAIVDPNVPTHPAVTPPVDVAAPATTA